MYISIQIVDEIDLFLLIFVKNTTNTWNEVRKYFRSL